MIWDPFIITVVALFICIAFALIRVLRGPTAPDRAVAVDIINTIVVGSMLLIGAAFNEIIYVDVAIVYALLSFIATLFIAKYLEGGEF